MLITLLYLQSTVALVFAIYLVYIMWGERLGIHNKKINFKKYLFMITIWALYTRTPWLSAIGVASDTPISTYKVMLFYLLTSGIVVAGYSLSYFIFHKLLEKNKLSISALGVILTVVFGEILRCLIFSFVMLGNNSSIGLNDINGSIAYALTMTPLVQLAYFGHIYYLTFILISLILCVFYFFTNFALIRYRAAALKAFWPLLLMILFIALQFAYLKVLGLQYKVRENILGGVNYPDINFRTLNTVATNTIFNILLHEKNIDLILLPENSLYMPNIHSTSTTRILNNFLTHMDKAVVSSSYYTDNINNQIYHREKQELFPFYEYMPYIGKFFGLKSPNNLKQGQDMSDFYFYKKTNSNKETIYKFQTIICSEHYSYDYMSKVKDGDYDFVVTQSSLTMFGQSDWLYASLTLNQIINASYIQRPYIVIVKNRPSFYIINNDIFYLKDDIFNLNYPPVYYYDL